MGLRKKDRHSQTPPGTGAEGRGWTRNSGGELTPTCSPCPPGVPRTGWPSSDATNALLRNKEGRTTKHTVHLEPRCGRAGGLAAPTGDRVRSDPHGRRPG